MATRDVTDDIRRGVIRPIPTTDRVRGVIDTGVDEYGSEVDDVSSNMSTYSRQQSGGESGSPEFEPAEFAVNKQTGEVMLPNGETMKLTAPVFMQLATLKSRDGVPLPTMDAGTLEEARKQGFRPASQKQFLQIAESTPTESDFFGSMFAAGKGTLGMVASAFDSFIGNDDPSNSWSRAQEDHANEQTLGQYKASQGRWYSGWDEFMSGMGETLGNIGGNVIAAAPLAAAGAAAGGSAGAGIGAIPGGVLGASMAVTGASGAYGEQANEYYKDALEAMAEMSPETLERESPVYREVVRERPGITHEEAMREVAIRGARVAGTTAGAVGAVEGLVGGKLAGNLLARMGVKKAILGTVTPVERKPGIGRAVGRYAGRSTALGAGAGVTEMAESMLGQAAGAAHTGVGDTDPMEHLNWDEGIKAAQSGLIFGALGRPNAAAGDAADAVNRALDGSGLGDALRDSPSLNEAAARTANARPNDAADQVANSVPRPTNALQARPPEQIRDQLENVLAERFGDNWQDNLDYIAQDRQQGGRQLIGQLMAAERAIAQGQVPLDAEGRDNRSVPPGDPFAPDALHLDGNPPMQEAPAAQQPPMQQADPSQQDLPGMTVGPQDRVATEPRGEPVPLNLNERRAAQQVRQQEMAEASAANPLPLEQRASVGVEQEITALEDQITTLEEQVAARAARAKRDPRLPPMRKALKEAKARLKQLEQQWQDERLAEGPMGVAPQARVTEPLPLDNPQGAPAETTSDGRPMGVAPAPVANPEPMAPEEARQRALTQLKRRGKTTAATATKQAATEQQLAQAAQSSEEQVSPSTAEPQADIEAQVAALADPQSERDTVFIAGDQYGDQRGQRGLPAGATEVYRKGVGTLITTSPAKAKRFKTGRLNDKTLQEILGYAQNKADVMRAGKEPVVVQAKTKTGAVAAEQLASPDKVPAARKAVKKLARKGAKVVETTPQQAQAERADPAKKSLKVADRKPAAKEPESKPKAKKSLKKSDKDDERTTAPSEAQVEAGNYPKRHIKVDGLDIAVETEAGQKRRPEWPALRNAYGYIKRTLGKDGDQVDVFLGPKADQPGNVYVIDQNKANGHFDEHKVMLGFDSMETARRAYLSNYARGWSGMGKVTPMTWDEFKTWVRDGKLTTERTRVESSNAMTVSERAAAAQTEAGKHALAIADAIAAGAARNPDVVTIDGSLRHLPERLTTRTGRKGAKVDLTVEALDTVERERLERMLSRGKLTGRDLASLESVLLGFRQVEAKLDAAVAAAEERLLASDEAKALVPAAEKAMLEVEQAAAQDKPGRKRGKARTSLLASLPLTSAEARGFLQLLRSEAKAELENNTSPAQSLARQMAGALNSQYPAAMEDARSMRMFLSKIAALTDEQLAEIAATNNEMFYHSVVAKQVMRGATEVAHAMGRMEQDLAPGQHLQSWADHLNQSGKKLPHATEHGTLPRDAQGVINTWIAQFEKGGNKFSAPVHVVPMSEAVSRYPQAFMSGVPTGKFLQLTDARGKTTAYVLSVDWGAFQTTEAAIEALAHEYGHAVTLEMYARADPRTRASIDKAYTQWLANQQGRSLSDILRDQMPGHERMLFKGFDGPTFNGQPSYATNFWEWSARNAALYVLDPARPHLTAVEKFFAKVGAAMRALYQTLTGAPKTDRAWAEAMDRWISGVERITPMPEMAPNQFNHDIYADGTKPPKDLRRDDVADRTAALSELQEMVRGPAATEKSMGDAVRDIWDALSHTKLAQLVKRVGLSLTTLRQIEQKYRDTPLGKYLTPWVRLQQEKAQLARTTMEAGSRAVEEANALDATVRTALERMMYYATHFGVHPDLPLTHKSNKHLLEGNDRVKAVQEKRYNMVRNLYRTLERADPRVPGVYAKLRDSFSDLREKTLEEMIENINASSFSDDAKSAIISRIKSAQREHRQGPYFPMMRFGNWIVSVNLPSRQLAKEDGTGWATKAEARDKMREQKALNPGANVSLEGNEADGFYLRVHQKGVYFFESEREAKAARPEIEAEVREYYDQHDVDYDTVASGMEADGGVMISDPKPARDNYNETKAVPTEFMAEMRKLLAEKKLDPDVAASLERLAIESLPENSYRQALLPRQNIFGASKQMLRAYATRFQGAAYNYATVVHGKDINQNWEKAWKTVSEHPDGGNVLNVLEAGQKAIADRMKPTLSNTWMSALTDASSLFSLGFSPAYAITNALQPTMITLPVLAGLVNPVTGQALGMAKATAALKSAYSGAIPHFTKKGFADFIAEARSMAGKANSTATIEETAGEILSRFGKDDGEKAMLLSLLSRGTLDFSWLNSLEDAMRGGKVGQKWANLQRMAMAFPQQVETMNRVTTALAAYRLAKSENLTDSGANALNDFADEIVAKTQLDYSRLNRPLAFNKPGWNVILQFKLYTQGMYMLFAQNASRMMATVENTPVLEGETPKQHAERVRQLRASGRRTLAYMFATHATFGGVTGLGPVASLAKLGLVTFAAMGGDDDDDKWKSGDQLMKELLRDAFGDDFAVVADKGLPALLGVDMSDRIGYPKLVDTKFTGISERDSAATGFDKMFLYAMGAPYSNARRMWQGVNDMAAGDARNAVNGLPTSLRGVMRGAKWAVEGVVDRDGDTFIGRDKLGWNDIALTSLGLSPTRTSEAYEDRSEVKTTTAKIMQARVKLMRDVNAGKAGREEVAEFNAAVPSNFRISSSQLAKSKKSKAERDRGVVNKQEAAVKRMLGQ